MKTSSCLTYSIASASLLALSFAHGLEGTHAPKLSTDEFHSRLKKDDSSLPNGGQLQMSYANVVDKILPSVVTVFSFGSKARQAEIDIEQLSPYDRRLYEYFRGQQEDEDTPQFPRGRRSPPNLRERGEDKLQPNGVGSGVIISTDGYILTNNHVVGEADKLEAVIDVKGVSKRFEAKIIGADPQTDVALIKIEAFDLIPAILSDSTKLRVGDIVLAAGAPMELSRSVTQGIVSALGRSGMGIIGSRKNGYEDFIQTDAAINPGNSGGPLVDALGRVVGINTAIYSKSGMSAGIGFAIPINLALRVAEDLIDDGAVTRGFLGVRPKDIDAETMKIWGLSDETGALVEIVTNNSPAAKAGVQVGDVIVGVQGQKVENASKLPLIVSSYKPGTVISIDVIRDGKPTTLQAKLVRLALDEEGNPIGLNSEQYEVPVSRAAPAAASVAEIVDGVTIQNLTPSTRERYEVPDEIQGVIVTLVNDESPAAATGIEEGDVILEIGRDKKKVRAVGEAVQMANSASNKVLLKVWRKGDMMMIMIDKK